ncbi:MAG: spore coat protein [Vallitaleaceae bacterium]|nr:spore coat protein [Vallitaleaceae bacterium]
MNSIRNDQDYANDLLMSEKQLCSALATAASEAATESIRNGFKNILSGQLDLQNQVFKTMSSNGWYQVDQADSTKIQQAKSKYSTFTV